MTLISFSVIAQKNITIKYRDNQEITYSLNHNSKLTFTDNELIILQPSGNIYYFDIENIRKIYFSNSNSLYDIASQKNINLYPNPSSGRISISNIKSKTLISIYNMKGELVMSEIIYHDKSINISNLSNGLYIVKVGNKEFKLVKE
jgi:hypothetical protein